LIFFFLVVSLQQAVKSTVRPRTITQSKWCWMWAFVWALAIRRLYGSHHEIFQ